jgi:hypothetical protein
MPSWLAVAMSISWLTPEQYERLGRQIFLFHRSTWRAQLVRAL